MKRLKSDNSLDNKAVQGDNGNQTIDQKENDFDDTSDSANNNHNIVILNQDVTRGGVKVETGRDSETGFIISRLSLINAQLTDIGNYTCRLSSWPEARPNTKGLYDTISVHVLQGENTEAIQQEANGASSIKTLSCLRSKNLVAFVHCCVFISLYYLSRRSDKK